MIKILHTYGPCLPLYLWWDVCLSMGINDCTYIFYIYFMQGNWIKMWYIMWVNIIFKVTGEILPGIQIEFKIYPIWIGDYLFFWFLCFLPYRGSTTWPSRFFVRNIIHTIYTSPPFLQWLILPWFIWINPIISMSIIKAPMRTQHLKQKNRI